MYYIMIYHIMISQITVYYSMLYDFIMLYCILLLYM